MECERGQGSPNQNMTSPILLICPFCGNLFWGKRAEILFLISNPICTNKMCPLCVESPLILAGLHAGAWNMISVVEEELPIDI